MKIKLKFIKHKFVYSICNAEYAYLNLIIFFIELKYILSYVDSNSVFLKFLICI